MADGCLQWRYNACRRLSDAMMVTTPCRNPGVVHTIDPRPSLSNQPCGCAGCDVVGQVSFQEANFHLEANLAWDAWTCPSALWTKSAQCPKHISRSVQCTCSSVAFQGVVPCSIIETSLIWPREFPNTSLALSTASPFISLNSFIQLLDGQVLGYSYS